jgi:catalase
LSNNAQLPANANRPPLSKAAVLLRLAAMGGVILAIVGTFAYLGGWFTPDDLTPAKFVDAFEHVDGVQSGFRRNHAKGVCVTGFFESNGQGEHLSRAIVFKAGRVPVMARFSLSGGEPYVADAPNIIRGLGLAFLLPDGEQWRTAMINLPVFPVNTPEGFYDRLVASEPDPKTGKLDPAKMAAFIASHPETVRAIKIIKSHPVSSGFDNSTFNSLNTFRFVNAEGVSTPVRWTVEPVQPFEAVAGGPMPRHKNYLFDALIESIHQHPLRWHLIVIIAEPGDPTNDATLPWPQNRQRVDVGTITIDHIESEDDSPIRDINFDPLVLPAGIEPSDDPLLSARSAVYSQSFTKRAGEVRQPSAISSADVQK